MFNLKNSKFGCNNINFINDSHNSDFFVTLRDFEFFVVNSFIFTAIVQKVSNFKLAAENKKN